MRIVQYRTDGTTACGIDVDGEIYATGHIDTLSLIRDGERGLERAADAPTRSDPVGKVHILAPLTNPGKILGSGVNYRSHGDEDPEFVFPDEVVWDFIKLSTAIVGPGDPIVIPPADDVIRRSPGGPAPLSEYGFAVDYEVEFGVVLGKHAKNVDRENALDHIFGYTVFNDVGSRSVQFHNGQRDLGKNFDTFCPMGPCIVTKDEIADLRQVRIESYVNGERRQSELIADQLNLPDVAIEWLSSIIRLDPGDVLSTGTPAGCGTFMNPPQFLRPGDVVKCTASGIGYIENRVVAGTARTHSGA